MTRLLPFVLAAAWVWLPSSVKCQDPDAKQVAQERKDAEIEAPKLAEVLGLRPGMTVADVGAGFGPMTVVLAKSLPSGQVLATDIGARQLKVIREYVKREGVINADVIEGTQNPRTCRSPAATPPSSDLSTITSQPSIPSTAAWPPH